MEVIQSLGKYEIRGTLGRGAMGTVYDGYDPLIARRVAIKAIPLPDHPDPETEEEIARFRREAQAAGRLTHPNIVGVYDYGEADALAYIVMEFVDGPTLKSVLDKQERFALPDILRIMEDLLTGLQFSHERGVVHRDIKPANLMLTSEGRAKIADFGIARIESSSMTQAGTVMGTPAYMSPEQFMGQVVDPRTDIYSAGVLLYQLLTGERPFDGSVTAIMHKVLNVDPPKPSQLSVTAPTALDAVVRRAMAKRPEDRFASATAFIEAIRAAMSAPAAAAAPVAGVDESEATMVSVGARARDPLATGNFTPSSPPPAPSVAAPATAAPASRPSRMPLVLGGGLVAVLLAGGGGWWFLTHQAPPTRVAEATSVGGAAAHSATHTSAPATSPTAAPAPAGTAASQTPAAPMPGPGGTQATRPAASTSPVSAPSPASPAPAGQETTASPPAPAPASTTPAPAPPPAPPAPVGQEAAANAPAPPQPAPPAVASTPSPAPASAPPAMPTTPAQQTAAAPPAPPTPAPPPAISEQVAAIGLGTLRQNVTRALADTRCALANGVVQDSGAISVGGMAGSSVDAGLRASIAGIAGAHPLDWQVRAINPVFCSALAVLRPVAPMAGAPAMGLRIGLVGGRTALHDGERILPQVTMADFKGEVRVDYLGHDGSLVHLYPTLADPTQHFVAVPSRVLTPGETLVLGRAGGGRPIWEAGPPYGTDMIIAVASSVPLLRSDPPQNIEDSATHYLRQLDAAISAARRDGAKVTATTLLVDTLPKAK